MRPFIEVHSLGFLLILITHTLDALSHLSFAKSRLQHKW